MPMFGDSYLSSVKPHNFCQLQWDDISLQNRKSEFHDKRGPFHPVFLLYSSPTHEYNTSRRGN